MAYRVAREGKRDLAEIFAYCAERAGLEIADRLIDSIVDRFALLSDFPDAGKPEDDIATGVKCFPVGRYLIYYRKSRRGVEIVHVFHGARDQKRAFKRAKK